MSQKPRRSMRRKPDICGAPRGTRKHNNGCGELMTEGYGAHQRKNGLCKDNNCKWFFSHENPSHPKRKRLTGRALRQAAHYHTCSNSVLMPNALADIFSI